MKRSKQCPKCSSRRVGFLPFQPEQTDDRAIRSLGTHTSGAGGMFSSVLKIGTLEAYVCAECGFHETYITAPGQIDFDQLDGFRWLNEQHDEGPYR